MFGELQSGIKVLDRMKSVTLLEPKRDGKPAPEQRVSTKRACMRSFSFLWPVERSIVFSSVRYPSLWYVSNCEPACRAVCCLGT